METLETLARGTYRARLVQDPDPTTPRENDNPSVMVCWHDRYWLGDTEHTLRAERKKGPAPRGEWFTSPDVFEEWWNEKHAHRKTSHRLPLYLYNHSGLSISTGSFSDRWDSGQVGWIYSTRETRRACGTKDADALAAMEAEVDEYDDFIRGDVYGIIVEREVASCRSCKPGQSEWEHVDSCYGFIGYDYAKKEMSRMLDEAIACAEKDPAASQATPSVTDALRAYVEYVEGKIDIDEVPLTRAQFEEFNKATKEV